MKKVVVFLMLLLLASCKTPQVVPLVLRDSVSITYKQGQTPLTPLIGEESEENVEYTFPKTTSLSERTKNSAVLIRVDTIVVERWHTQQVPAPDKPIPRFYKDCTKGFWILLLLLFGSIGLRILRAVAFRK